jgi:hypothetical protein
MIEITGPIYQNIIKITTYSSKRKEKGSSINDIGSIEIDRSCQVIMVITGLGK